MGGTRTGRTETVKATNQKKNKYIFNLSLRKQYLNCGKKTTYDGHFRRKYMFYK